MPTAKGHDIDGFAEGAEAQKADEDRERNGDCDNDGALPIAEEDQNHEGRQDRGDQRFAKNTFDGGADEERLVEEGGEVQAFGQRRGVIIERLLHTADDIERGG